ncbi:MAG: SEL1-like repeat protein [Pseudomonadota bacterium]
MARFEMAAIDAGAGEGAAVSSGALLQLGIMYSLGREVERDLIAAHKWFNLAALRGNECAKQYRRDISSEMAPEEIAQAQREAREWLYTLH